MTCASCANRVERRLNRLDGVTASVNYATEKARVEFDPARSTPERSSTAVEAAGYGASLPRAEPAPARRPSRTPTAPLRTRLIVSALLSCRCC